MKLQNIKTGLSRMTGRSGLLLKKHSPEILMTVGVVGIVTSTVMTCKATLKVDGVLDNYDEKKGKIEKVRLAEAEKEKIGIEEIKYTDKDYRKDLVVIKTQTAAKFVKLYGPSVTLGVASIGCILGAHNIMRKRNLAVIAAYKAVEQSFSDYRKRVVDEFGEEKDRLFKNGIKQEKVTVVETDENGKSKKTQKTVETIDPNGISEYARFFDESCSQWDKNSDYNLAFLKCQQNTANDLLHSRGHIFLNEVYDMLGIPRSKAGAVVGWVEGTGDDYVDFGIFDGDNMKARDFVNGYERSILLDFNVSGMIYDLI
jgi:hypothetical protein